MTPRTLVQKILATHGADRPLEPGDEVTISVDQSLIHDGTGVAVGLHLESMNVDRVRPRVAVCYVDHQLVQIGTESNNDHRYLESVSARFGLRYSRAGNGICHQVHLERFAVPGDVLVGGDSHTPMGGGMGMLSIGVGSLDTAVALATGRYVLPVPRTIRITLEGRLAPWVSAKDVVLEVLRRLTVKGGVGAILEYGGPGVATLSVPERGTIANMAVELGATTAIFPSDERTREFLAAQGRAADYRPLEADPGARYDQEIVIDLGGLVPLVAKPPSPDAVVPVSEVEGTPIQQVAVGSCTNSSYRDLMTVVSVLKGRRIAPSIDVALAPGSRQVLQMLARNGGLADLLDAGARILESGCGPCPGMGQVPASGSVSLRTFNRNFAGRCGSHEVSVYLASPETAVASALEGVIRDPRRLGEPPRIAVPAAFIVDDSHITPPPADGQGVPLVRGDSIKPLPVTRPVEDTLTGEVLLKLPDDINTDDISPSGARLMPLRSNIPALSEYTFRSFDPTFPARARAAGGGIVVSGANYGQGSSRESAALQTLHLGIRAVIAKSFARIHRSNLINFAVAPLVFGDEAGYDAVAQGDRLRIDGLAEALREGRETVMVANETRGTRFPVRLAFTPRERGVLVAGGLRAYLASAA
ncbi:MAG TPA: aconitate hydratase [Thermodesulfobacteriota bacterium]